MKINCLSCGHNIDIGEAYDSYRGSVKCFVCGTLLDIRTEEGNIKSVRAANTPPRPSPEQAIGQTR